ncbi:PA2169 family four-helix-bundle protein [Methyloversatilis sp.]|uniref:ferritin-like domain-containing protein n=1 Tax=Methyloversatilis sp. TaxID=2569862 RepID=UPI002735295D|nr:PA2169 family four-helix-bundle protein [Methyloversatilis sp.]MDP2869207.1 PA2169 family four-helix-bundle protein [Methyloversatilis sp.]MDP3289445.1 PA2169 family four-helix-bundle protein [Methyloversatilis sp.]MDP3457234.1 PA2169 family four-helix-bundle protein [Methyloversatilis sp.]MDP3576626.1 PA2169 family four-helix-bundle protein [Methyloversatilis sp.]
MNQSETIEVLNGLIETCKDGEYGFNTCADQADSVKLQSMFRQRADECRSAAQELQTEVVRAGGEADTSGTVVGALHRGWVSVRGALPGKDDVAMLEEAERGEDRALARYRKALEAPLPPELRNLVQRQLIGAQRNHDQIRALRDEYRAAA